MFSLSSFLDLILPYSGPAVPDLAYIETDPVEEGEIPEAFPDRPGMPSFTFMLSSTYVFNFFTCWFYPTFPLFRSYCFSRAAAIGGAPDGHVPVHAYLLLPLS